MNSIRWPLNPGLLGLVYRHVNWNKIIFYPQPNIHHKKNYFEFTHKTAEKCVKLQQQEHIWHTQKTGHWTLSRGNILPQPKKNYTSGAPHGPNIFHVCLWLFDSVTLWLFYSVTVWLCDCMALWLSDRLTVSTSLHKVQPGCQRRQKKPCTKPCDALHGRVNTAHCTHCTPIL